ncbi:MULTISPECIES: hypothetical protein [unclassified Streptomyces]|uniref:hypothetical protein n=1 Tax=unclassified Streptomyces TaxID=2593676 RepID=UPI00278BCBEA|nr:MULTISPECIES: hypothetical protein [unclassified Streptomyces]
MSDTTPQAELKSRYADRIADDLAHNENELKRISEEIAALQAELGTLEENRALLESMLKSLSSGELPPTPAPTAAKAVGRAAGKVPRQQTREKAVAPKSPKASKAPQSKKARETPAAAAKATKSAAPAKTVTPTVKKSGQQSGTLVDLIVSQLGAETSPRSAAEITTTLQKAHPKREFNIKVVRNTLEALVAKARAERTRQKRSVFYVASPAATDTKAGQDKAAESKPAEPKAKAAETA